MYGMSRWWLAVIVASGLFGAVVLPGASPQAAADDQLVDLVVGLLNDSDPDIRALAYEQVRTDVPGSAATQRLAAELDSLSADGQAGLLSALADRGDPAARPQVVKVLSSTQDPAVRVAAVRALGSLGHAEDLPRLIELLSSSDDPLQQAARRSLVRLSGEDVSPAIAKAMGSASRAVQVTLIDVLVERRAVDTIPHLLLAAVGDDAVVRGAAMGALGELAEAEHIPDMLAGVLRAERGRERVAAEKAVMFACARIEDDNERAEPVLLVLRRASGEERDILLSTLGRVGGAKALAVIEQAIASRDPRQHDLGIRAVCNWPDASIAPRLMELAKNENKEGHRVMCLRALIRVAPLPDERSDAQRLTLLKQAFEMSSRDEEQRLVLERARAVRIVETLRFLLPFVDDPQLSEVACESIVELAHHRGLREVHKEEFHAALDKVMTASGDPVIDDRAQRYKKDQTWVRPK